MITMKFDTGEIVPDVDTISAEFSHMGSKVVVQTSQGEIEMEVLNGEVRVRTPSDRATYHNDFIEPWDAKTWDPSMWEPVAYGLYSCGESGEMEWVEEEGYLSINVPATIEWEGQEDWGNIQLRVGPDSVRVEA